MNYFPDVLLVPKGAWWTAEDLTVVGARAWAEVVVVYGYPGSGWWYVVVLHCHRDHPPGSLSGTTLHCTQLPGTPLPVHHSQEHHSRVRVQTPQLGTGTDTTAGYGYSQTRGSTVRYSQTRCSTVRHGAVQSDAVKSANLRYFSENSVKFSKIKIFLWKFSKFDTVDTKTPTLTPNTDTVNTASPLSH